MEFKHQINILGKHIWTIEIEESEIAVHMPGLMEKEMKKVYEATKKPSDGIMYLSEVVKSIEDNNP